MSVTGACSLQGEMLDNIELNVMHTVDHVEKARDETKRAVKYQGQARKVRLSRRPQRRVHFVHCLSLFLSSAYRFFCCYHLLHLGQGSHD